MIESEDEYRESIAGFSPKSSFYRRRKWLGRTFLATAACAAIGTVLAYLRLPGEVLVISLSVALTFMAALIPEMILANRARDREDAARYTTLPPPNESNVAEVDPWTGRVLRQVGMPPLSKKEWTILVAR